jgi:flagellar hook protein FlgE
MGTALFTGVNGLLVQQRKLDVIASNIANVNTNGYRGARVLFQDLFAQTLRGGSAPVGNFGGTNGQQVGLGVQVGSIDVNFSQGGLQTTGISSDLAIQGQGFFVLSDGVSQFYSRDGSFDLNSGGLLIDPSTGLRIQGYLANDEGVIEPNAALTDIVIPIGTSGIVRPTSNVSFSGNLSADAIAGDTVVRTMTIIDSLGAERDVQITFTRAAATNTWDWVATYDNGTTTPQVGTGQLVFNSEGALPDPTTGTIQIQLADLGAPTPDTVPTTPIAFTVDFTTVSQLSGGGDATSDITVINQDGFPRGVLESFNIGENGQINGVFTNGLTRTIAQVSLATFSNVGGLTRAGDNLFRDTPASGVAQIGAPNSGGRGSVSGGVLENSNVDLGTEFSNLIVTQRSFQANARTITTADTILQETVNLVR